MAKESRVKIVKKLIEDKRLPAFANIFDYLPKTEFARSMGINYARFLSLVKNPKRLRYEEAIAIAKLIGVAPRLISDLIHNQIEAKKK